MTQWMPLAGDTLFIASGPTGDHLFVIGFSPRKIQGCGSSEMVLLVPFCTVPPSGKHDSACIVQAGEHSFITHESYMDYRSSRADPISHIRAQIADGLFKAHGPVTAPLLHKIQHGLSISTRVPRHIKDDFLLP